MKLYSVTNVVLFLAFNTLVLTVSQMSPKCPGPPKLLSLNTKREITLADTFNDANISFTGLSYSERSETFVVVGSISKNEHVIQKFSLSGSLQHTFTLTGFSDIESIVVVDEDTVIVGEKYPTVLTKIDLKSAENERTVVKGFGSAASVYSINIPVSRTLRAGIEGLAYDPSRDVVFVATERAYPRVFAVKLESGQVELVLRVHHLSPMFPNLSVRSLSGLEFEHISRSLLVTSEELTKTVERISTPENKDTLEIVESLEVGPGTFANITGEIKGIVHVPRVEHGRYGLAVITSEDRKILVLEGECEKNAVNSCSNGVVDATESDTDCGGLSCPACPTGGECTMHIDCGAAEHCSRDGRCQPSDPNLSPDSPIGQADEHHEQWLWVLLPLLFLLACFGMLFCMARKRKERQYAKLEEQDESLPKEDGSALNPMEFEDIPLT